MAAYDALIIIEQPELHLHPEAQANIADLLIDSINERRPRRLEDRPGREMTRDERMKKTKEMRAEAKAEGEPTSRRFLVETHSETILLRLRVELARTMPEIPGDFPLSPEDLICYYLERDRHKGISRAERITFDSKGEFLERPATFFDFFGQDFKETMDLKRARLPKGT